eukprot:622446_1
MRMLSAHYVQSLRSNIHCSCVVFRYRECSTVEEFEQLYYQGAVHPQQIAIRFTRICSTLTFDDVDAIKHNYTQCDQLVHQAPRRMQSGSHRLMTVTLLVF